MSNYYEKPGTTTELQVRKQYLCFQCTDSKIQQLDAWAMMNLEDVASSETASGE